MKKLAIILNKCFKVDKIGLLWKKIPLCIVNLRGEETAPDFNIAKNYIGDNTNIECQIKILSLDYFDRILKGILKGLIPMLWLSMNNACMIGPALQRGYHGISLLLH